MEPTTTPSTPLLPQPSLNKLHTNHLFSEKEAGEGIRRAISDGLVKRSEIFITTKLWNNYHARDHAISMAHAQNAAWGCDYIDLYLIHFPIALEYVDPKQITYPGWWTDAAKTTISRANVPVHETWSALEALVDDGTARSIGISNAQAQTLYDISTYAKHPCSSLQIEHHPYLAQPELISLAADLKIVVTAYSSFGPQSFLELPEAFRARAKDIPLLFDAEPVTKAAARTGKTPAQVLLRWATQRGIAVIPKSNNVGRLAQNLDVVGWDLTQEEIKAISALDRGLRFNDPGFYLAKPLRIFA